MEDTKKRAGFLKWTGNAIAAMFGVVIVGSILHNLVTTPEQRAHEAQEQARHDARMPLEDWAAANEMLAERRVKGVLKDPDSAQFTDLVVIKPKSFDPKRPGVVCGNVNAKNSFGGYTGPKQFIVIAGIPMIEDGKNAFVRLWNRECANQDVL